MTIDPILSAPALVQLHLAAAAVAVLAGPVALYRRRRDAVHRVVGHAWVAGMLVLAISGLFIRTLAVIGPFGPIHLLSVFTLFALWRGVMLIRAGRIGEHGRWMKRFYWSAVWGAGLFTILPGRTLNEVLFGTDPHRGPWVIAAAAGGAVLVAVWRWARPAFGA